MKYTVITKSGWQSDFWRIDRTFDSKQDATEYCNRIQKREPRDDSYNTKIVAGNGKNNGDGSWTYSNRGNKITAWL